MKHGLFCVLTHQRNCYLAEPVFRKLNRKWQGFLLHILWLQCYWMRPF